MELCLVQFKMQFEINDVISVVFTSYYRAIKLVTYVVFETRVSYSILVTVQRFSSHNN